MRAEFLKKGCNPTDEFPIYFVLGKSPWLEKNKPQKVEGMEISIPLAYLSRDDVSFTYPDSMISLWFSKDIPSGINDTGLFGKVFTKEEIEELVNKRGDPEEKWNTNIPENLAPT